MASEMGAAEIPVLAGIGGIAADYDGLILDLWGVLHDGAKPFPACIDALTQAARTRARRCSSSPTRRAAPCRSSQRLAEIGVAPRAL